MMNRLFLSDFLRMSNGYTLFIQLRSSMHYGVPCGYTLKNQLRVAAYPFCLLLAEVNILPNALRQYDFGNYPLIGEPQKSHSDTVPLAILFMPPQHLQVTGTICACGVLLADAVLCLLPAPVPMTIQFVS